MSIKKSLGIASLVALGALTTGCADNGITLFIRQVPVPDPSDGCSLDNDPETAHLLAGYMDRSLTTSYQQVFLVGNQMIQRGDTDQLRPESGRVQLYEMEVGIFNFDSAQLGGFTVPVAGFVEPATAGLPGFGVTYGTLMDAATSALIDTSTGGQTVVARVQIFGTSLGGVEVETGLFDWPIFVCGIPRAGNTPGIPCIGAFEPASCDEAIQLPCLPGQDTTHDARYVEAVTGANVTSCF